MCVSECVTKPASTTTRSTDICRSSRASLIVSRGVSAITAFERSGSCTSRRPHSNQARPMNTMRRTSTIGARWTRKSLKVKPARLAMMIFGGSPISVAVPPILLAIASASRKGIGFRPIRSHSSSVTGATSKTVVTLSSRAEAKAVMTMSITIIRNGRAFARCADQMARNSKTPVSLRIPTMIIIPKSKKMTFQSMPVSSEKNISCPRVAPMITIAAAPPSATAARFSFSVAIRTYAAAKTAIASQAVALTRCEPPATPLRSPRHRPPSHPAPRGSRRCRGR